MISLLFNLFVVYLSFVPLCDARFYDTIFSAGITYLINKYINLKDLIYIWKSHVYLFPPQKNIINVITLILENETNYYNVKVGPGSRSHAATWIDNQNNYWLFGGLGYTSECTLGIHSFCVIHSLLCVLYIWSFKKHFRFRVTPSIFVYCLSF